MGNTDEDPIFVDPEDGDYTLSPGSPCIDAGNPTSDVPEGGGDRIDMGAFEFPQRFNGLLIFEGYPEIAFTGSTVSWEAAITNPTPYPQTIDGWIDFSGPVSGTSIKYLDRAIPPGERSKTLEVTIPEFVEEGVYTVKGRVGIYSEALRDSEVFDLEIVDGTEQAKVVFH